MASAIQCEKCFHELTLSGPLKYREGELILRGFCEHCGFETPVVFEISAVHTLKGQNEDEVL